MSSGPGRPDDHLQTPAAAHRRHRGGLSHIQPLTNRQPAGVDIPAAGTAGQTSQTEVEPPVGVDNLLGGEMTGHHRRGVHPRIEDRHTPLGRPSPDGLGDVTDVADLNDF